MLGMVVQPQWARLIIHGDAGGNLKLGEVRSKLGLLANLSEGSDIHILQSKSQKRWQGQALWLRVFLDMARVSVRPVYYVICW